MNVFPGRFRPVIALATLLLVGLVSLTEAVEDVQDVFIVKLSLPTLERASASSRAEIEALRSLQDDKLAALAQVVGRELQPVHRYFASQNGFSVLLSSAEARRLATGSGVSSVRRERVFSLATWNSPGFIGADLAWSGAAAPDGQPLRGEGRIAAVLDTGLPADPHPSFANDPDCAHGTEHLPKVLATLDCSSTDDAGFCNGPDPYDQHGHGSHVAGTLAGNRVDRSAELAPPIPSGYDFISGVAPCASIRSYKVCPQASCPESHILAGLNQVLLDGDADVLNFSISGGRDPWRDNDRPKLDLVAAGMVVVAAAGNTGPSVPNPIAAVNHLGPWVLTVAASSRNASPGGVPAQGDVLAPFSLRGPTPAPLANLQKPDLTGPGIDIRAASPDGYTLRSGTSMASPHVAGAALLLRQAHPDWTPMEIKSALRMSAVAGGKADDGETPWHPDQVGSGRVDLGQAARVGLVLDENLAAFKAARPVLGGDVRSLNLPALRDLDCSPSCRWTRTLRNTLTDPSHWQVEVIAPETLVIEVSPAEFSLRGGLQETVPLSIQARPLADLDDGIHFAEVRLIEQDGRSPDLRLTVAVKGQAGAALVVDPAVAQVHAEQGASAQLVLDLANPGADTLNWQARTASLAAAGGQVSKTVPLPAFSLAGSGPGVTFSQPIGADQIGRVTGLRFQGSVDLEPDSWASDLRMKLQSPQGDVFAVGGFATLDRPWDFQGMGSALSDSYASAHDQPFGPAGTALAGEWLLTFSNDFADGGRMDWQAVTLRLDVDPGYCDPAPVPDWLTIMPEHGQIEPGGGSTLELQIDATELAVGAHQAALCLTSNAFNTAELAVPVRVDVFPAPGPDQALISGQVLSAGACDAEPAPLADAELSVGQAGPTVRTSPAGYFQLPVTSGLDGQALVIAAPGHQPVSIGLPELNPGQQHPVSVSLRLDQTCARLEATPTMLAVAAAEQGEIELLIDNSGAAALDWRLVAGAGPACQYNPPGWLEGTPANGALAGDQSATWPLLADSAGLAPGHHPVRLCLFEGEAALPISTLDLVINVLPGPSTWILDGVVEARGHCGQPTALPSDTRLELANQDGIVRDVEPGADGLFQLGADTRFQPYALTVQAEGFASDSATDLVAEAGAGLALELSLVNDQPCAAMTLKDPINVLEAGQATQVQLHLDNLAGAATLDWQLSFAEALPARLPDGSRPHDPALDETLVLPPVALAPPGQAGSAAQFVIDGGVDSSGRVIGLSFAGQASGLSQQPGRGSDLQLEVSAPDQTALRLGGFSNLVNPWSFQGPASDQDGTYTSSHWLNGLQQPLFGDEGVVDAGLWQLRLAHDWHSSQAATMHWQALSVTLHKMAAAGCSHPVQIPWLALEENEQGGVLAAGEQRAVPISIDTGDLELGRYRALICLASSDVHQPLQALEIELIVEQNLTRVFTDRFEDVE